MSTSPFNRTAQHDAKRVAILSEAARLFNSRGSRATTLKDIAESLGLTKTSLYYYVKTKEDLIYQCYMAALEHHHACLDQIEEKYTAPADRASAVLLQFFEGWMDAQEGRGPHIAALLEIASLKGKHRTAVETRYIEMFKRLRQYLREGIEQGTIRPCHVNSATRAIMGSVEWLFFWLARVPLQDVPQLARDALDILSHGLASGEQDYPYAELNLGTGDDQAVLSGFDRDEQNRLKQEAFYKVGTRFFNKQGFAGTSLDEIAEHLQVSKGAFYYHIKNKEDLLYACYERSLAIANEVHQQVNGMPLDGIHKLEQICRRTFHIQNSDSGPLIRFNTITALSPNRRRQILKANEVINDSFVGLIDAGIEDGSIRRCNSFVAQNLISGATNAAMDISLWRKIDDIDSAGVDYFEVFLNGLSPRKPR